MLIMLALAIVLIALTVVFVIAQIVSAIQNHRATRGVTIYRIDKDGNLKKI